MNTPAIAISGYFKSLQLLHVAFCTGLLLFGAVATGLTHGGQQPLSSGIPLMPLRVAVAGLMAAGIFGGIEIYGRKVRSAAIKDDTESKLAVYRTAFIIRLALVEAPTLFCIVAFMLSGDLVCLFSALLLWVGMAWKYRPVRSDIEQELQLDGMQELRPD